MLQGLVNAASRLLHQLSQRLFGDRQPAPELLPVSLPKTILRRLERVRVTDQVCRTLFEEFEKHRRTKRGEEEIGWVLLGVREETSALVLATLPAGADRNAGVAHVRFNSNGQRWPAGLYGSGISVLFRRRRAHAPGKPTPS